MAFGAVVSLWPVIHFWAVTASRSVILVWSEPAKALIISSQGYDFEGASAMVSSR